MKNLTFIAFLILTLCSLSFGQNVNCPKLSVTGPSSVVQPGETMTFTANIDKSEIDSAKLTYQWSVDKGTIIEGQGERTILVSTEGLADATITATAEIKGLSSGCVNFGSETGVVAVGCALPIQLDEFGKLSRNDEKARLEALVAELVKEPEMNAYIILYHPANKKSYENKVARFKTFLVKDNKILPERIIIVPGGIEPEERVKIYALPIGFTPPTP